MWRNLYSSRHFIKKIEDDIMKHSWFWGVFSKWKSPIKPPCFSCMKELNGHLHLYLYEVESQMIKVQMKHRLRMDLHKTSSPHIYFYCPVVLSFIWKLKWLFHKSAKLSAGCTVTHYWFTVGTVRNAVLI